MKSYRMFELYQGFGSSAPGEVVSNNDRDLIEGEVLSLFDPVEVEVKNKSSVFDKIGASESSWEAATTPPGGALGQNLHTNIYIQWIRQGWPVSHMVRMDLNA